MRKSRDSYRHGNLPQVLIEDALHLLETRTVDELSVRELADRAGVSPRAPYLHFPTKRELLKAVAIRGFARLAEAGERAGSDLVKLGEAYIKLGVENPNLFRLMFSGIVGDDCETADESYQQVSAAIRLRQPTWDAPQVSAASLGLWAFVHGLTELRLLGLVSEENWNQISLPAILRAFGEVLK